jgi:hypothetical protein
MFSLPAEAVRTLFRKGLQLGTRAEPGSWRLLSRIAMSKSDTLRYGPPGENAVHLCVDMQRMFAEATEWKMSWLERVLPNIVAITSAHAERTVFTRFIPARKPGQGAGMWRHYYERWASMTIDRIGPDVIELVPDLTKFVPPAKTFDKHVYSPWTGSVLHMQLRDEACDHMGTQNRAVGRRVARLYWIQG